MEEKKKSYTTQKFRSTESQIQKVRFEDETGNERIFSGRQEKHSNEVIEKEQKNFQKQNHNKLKKYILPESKNMVCKLLRQDEEKSSRRFPHRTSKETKKQAVKNDASPQKRNNRAEERFSTMNEVDVNNRICEMTVVKINENLSSSNQNLKKLHSRSKNQSVIISKELGMRSNVSDKLPSANGDSSVGLSEARCKNIANTHEEFYSSNQNDCAYSETTNLSVMPNPVVDEFNQPYSYEEQNLKVEYQNEKEHTNNLSQNSYYNSEQQVNPAYENGVICSSVDVLAHYISPDQSAAFENFELQDLLHYNVNLMQAGQLFCYASALRNRIMQRIGDFKNNVKDELQFLCALSDGTQTEKNQILITERTCRIIKSLFKQHAQTNKLDASSKKTESCASSYIQHHHQNHTESNPPRVQYISRAVNPQADNYICMNNGSQAVEANQRYSGENMKHKALYKNVQLCDDRPVSEKNVQSWYNHNAYENGKAHSTRSDPMENSTVGEKHVEHSNMAINSEESEYLAKKSAFIHLTLPQLLQCNLVIMQGDLLKDYAFTVKKKVLLMLDEIENPIIRDKLEFMCEITDGTQRDENQKLITDRMCYFISKCIEANEAPT